MTVTYRKVGVSQALVEQDSGTKSLIVPPSAAVYLSDKATLATIYSNETGTTMSNPVPTGVAIGVAGLDTAGNLNVWLDLGITYFVLVNGVYLRLSTVNPHGADFTDHLGTSGAVTDPHGDRAWASSQFVSQTDTSTFAKLAGSAGTVRF